MDRPTVLKELKTLGDLPKGLSTFRIVDGHVLVESKGKVIGHIKKINLGEGNMDKITDLEKRKLNGQKVRVLTDEIEVTGTLWVNTAVDVISLEIGDREKRVSQDTTLNGTLYWTTEEHKGEGIPRLYLRSEIPENTNSSPKTKRRQGWYLFLKDGKEYRIKNANLGETNNTLCVTKLTGKQIQFNADLFHSIEHF